MPPQLRSCVVCQHRASRYTCVSCRVNYCSVACYKSHKGTCNIPSALPAQDPDPPKFSPDSNIDSPPLQDPTPARPLTSLKWPYVPDTSAYPDPLTRDDPKLLQLHQYEAIATSPAIRSLLTSPHLRTLLTSIDTLRGAEREEAIQRALGVHSRLLKNDDHGAGVDEETKIFRELAEAVERAARGEREDVLGLDWD